MTSKNLFFKRMKQDLEQRIWLPVLFFIIGFLAMEIALISKIDFLQDRTSYVERMTEYLMDTFFSINSLFTILTVAVAVVSGISGFSYMHSAKKLDVYHSIPVKREKLFLQQYAYGILYYVVPLVLHVLISFGLCAANDFGGASIFGQAMGFLLIQILIYLLFYAVTVLSVTLTGSLVISVLGCCVLFAYSLILSYLKQMLMDNFYMTYYSGSDILDFPAFSPVHQLCNLIEHMGRSNEEYLNYTGYMWDYAKILLMTVICTGVAIYLYKKRPTEAADRTMAFPVTEPIVKTMVVFPGSIVGGYIFAAIVSNVDNMRWFTFGCIFSFLIICPLMEILFRKDVKAVLAHPLQLVFNGVCVIAVLIVMHFDVLGYDTYIPDEDKVESYSVYLGGMPYIYSTNGSSIQERLNNMQITDNPGARKLFEHAAKITRPARTRKGVTADIRGNVPEDSEAERSYSDMVVGYNLKNGKTVYRSYLIAIDDEQVMQWLGELVDSMEYKLAAYPILADASDDSYIGINVDWVYDAEMMQLSESDMQRLLETYQRELTNLTFAEMLTDFPVAELAFLHGKPVEEIYVKSDGYAVREYATYAGDSFDYYGEESGYEIYPFFTETLALLEEYGVNLENPLSAENVDYILIDDGSLEENDKNGLMDKQIQLTYANKATEQAKIDEIVRDLGTSEIAVEKIGAAEIEQILAAAVPRVFGSQRYYAQDSVEEYIDVELAYKRDGRQRYITCYFKKGSIPEFVAEDIEEAKAQIVQ